MTGAEVAAVIKTAHEVTKAVNDFKKKVMDKQPEEIDETDILEGMLRVADTAIGGFDKPGEADIENAADDMREEIDEDSFNEVEKSKERVELTSNDLRSSVSSEMPEEIDADSFANPMLGDGEKFPENDLKTDLDNDTIPKTGVTTDANEMRLKKGGSYGEVFVEGEGDKYEVHHMPADSASYLERNDGPAIKMEKSDHRQTESCGNSREAREYREKQKDLINEGKFREAIQMDIDDIHEKFGDKYDDAISEMLDYVDKLEKEGIING